VFSRTEIDSSEPGSLTGETDCVHIEDDGSGSPRATTAACDGDAADDDPDVHMDILFTVALLTPQAHYEVVLDRHNPLGRPPVVRLPEEGAGKGRYLSALDRRRLRWGLQQVRRVLRTAPLSSVVVEEVSPAHEAEWTEEELEGWIDRNHYPNNHWVGTARMGRSSAPAAAGGGAGEEDASGPTGDIAGSVVDEQLVVRGTTNLYVADASAIPVIPNGNVHSTVTVVASMAAECILRKFRFLSALLA
jgi:choline dehydrogenase